MDETKTKIDNRWMYLWAAIDRHKGDSGCLSLSSKEWIGHTDIPQEDDERLQEQTTRTERQRATVSVGSTEMWAEAKT